MNTDKAMQFVAGIVGVIALVVLVWLDPSRGQWLIPVIIAIVAGLSSFEAGRRKQKRRQ